MLLRKKCYCLFFVFFGYFWLYCTSLAIYLHLLAYILVKRQQLHTLRSVCSQDNWDDDEEDEEKKTDVKKAGLYSSTACLSLMDYT